MTPRALRLSALLPLLFTHPIGNHVQQNSILASYITLSDALLSFRLQPTLPV